MKLKTLLTTALTALSIVASACWFTQDNFNGNYIAFVTGDNVHYEPTELISNAVYKNGYTVDMPFTVYVKVSDRFADQTGESPGAKKIVRAVLQYKVLPGGNWVTVKELKNLDWDMNFQNPVSLFGRNTINITNISANTEILIRLYLSDGTYETGDLNTDITSPILDTAHGNISSEVSYEGGWTAPFVFRVKYSGKVRPNR